MEWLAGAVATVAAAVLVYALERRARRRAEKRAERSDRREQRREKRERERFERETAEEEAKADEEDDYSEFLAEVEDHFEFGGRSLEVEPEDRARALRAVDEGLFDDEWRRGKLFLYRRGRP